MSIKANVSDEKMDNAEALIYDLESKFSVTKSDSEVSRLNNQGVATVSDDTLRVIKTASEISMATDGAVDISVYPVVKAWGFTTGEYRVPTKEELNELLEYVDYEYLSSEGIDGNTVRLKDGMEIDLGCIAKGYTGDAIMNYLRSTGCKCAIVSLGGNVHTLGHNIIQASWRVAIQDPIDLQSYIGVLEVTDVAVITSGSYQRYFEENGEKYHHIIDPSTGYPANNGLESVTVIGQDGVICDALSTALFVMGLDELTKWWQENYDEFKVDVIAVDSNGTIYATKPIMKNFKAASGKKVVVITKE